MKTKLVSYSINLDFLFNYLSLLDHMNFEDTFIKQSINQLMNYVCSITYKDVNGDVTSAYAVVLVEEE